MVELFTEYLAAVTATIVQFIMVIVPTAICYRYFEMPIIDSLVIGVLVSASILVTLVKIFD